MREADRRNPMPYEPAVLLLTHANRDLMCALVHTLTRVCEANEANRDGVAAALNICVSAGVIPSTAVAGACSSEPAHTSLIE